MLPGFRLRALRMLGLATAKRRFKSMASCNEISRAISLQNSQEKPTFDGLNLRPSLTQRRRTSKVRDFGLGSSYSQGL